MALICARLSCPQVAESFSRLSIAFCGQPLLTAIVDPLSDWLLACFVTIIVVFRRHRCCCWNFGIDILVWVWRLKVTPTPWYKLSSTMQLYLVDCWLNVCIVQSYCRSFIIVDAVFALFDVSRIHFVMGLSHLWCQVSGPTSSKEPTDFPITGGQTSIPSPVYRQPTIHDGTIKLCSQRWHLPSTTNDCEWDMVHCGSHCGPYHTSNDRLKYQVKSNSLGTALQYV